MKIQIVSCCLEEGNLSFPLGALSILAAIHTHPILSEVTCELKSYTLSDDPILASEQVAETQATHVGLSIYLWNRTWFDQFSKHLKELQKDVVLFCGGTEVTANPLSFDLDLYSFLTLGEGEETTCEALCQLLENTALQGKGIVTKESPITYAYPENLDTLASVFLSGAAEIFVKPGSSVLWEMTRGCPFNCAFCFESKGIRSVRHYAYERIEEELDYLVSHGIEDVFILDPTFNMDKKRTVKMLSLLVRKAQSIHFTFELRAELLDEELADLFAQLNCALQIGLQSSRVEVLQTINRSFNPKLFEQKIDLLNKRGIVFGLDLIIGLPHDSYSLFCESLNYAVHCKPSNIDIFALSLLPGTQLADDASKFSIRHLTQAPYTVLTTPSYTEQDVAKALMLKEACDLFYTKGQACMWIHSLCEATELEASSIFAYFSAYMNYLKNKKGIDPQENDIYELQEWFVRDLLKKLNKEKYLSALLSFMELHQGISFLHETGEGPVIHIDYELDELALLDTLNIQKFVLKHPHRHPQTLGIFEDEDGSISFVEQKS
ncbi:MAG: radical SAM protein [Sphaerochaeta sp.]